MERVSGVLFRSAISGQTHRYARPEDSFPEVNANGRELWGRGGQREGVSFEFRVSCNCRMFSSCGLVFN